MPMLRGMLVCQSFSVYFSDILFPLQPPPLPIPTNPPSRPTREGWISVHFGSVWLRSAPFGSVWLRFGSVSGVLGGVLGGVVVGSARGASVREKNITSLLSHPLTRCSATPSCCE